MEKDPALVDSPISVAVDLSKLKSSSNASDSTLVEVVSLLQEIRGDQQILVRAARAQLETNVWEASPAAVKTQQNFWEKFRSELLADAVREHNRKIAKSEREGTVKNDESIIDP